MKKIQSKITKLEKKATDLQVKSAQRFFTLTFEDSLEYQNVLDLIDNDYTWQSKSAALTVHVYDKIKEAAEKAEPTEGGIDIKLQATIMTGLYNILLNIEAVGVKKARVLARILTNIGHQVSAAMNTLAQDNEEIKAIHLEIAELEQKLTENETSEQVEETA
jgi:hypothetical protein